MKDTIVVYDSGLGGLNIFNKLIEKYPNNSYCFIGDFKNLPYGTKSIEFLKERIKTILDYFKEAKCIIIACNTASSVYRLMNLNYDNVFEIINVTSNYAYNKSINKRIGVIGTNLTIELGMYEQNLTKLKARSYNIKYSELVDIIESKHKYTYEEYLKIVRESLNEKFKAFNNTNIDTLICGCTHFGYLIGEYKKILGDINYITSDDAVVDEVSKKVSFNNEKCQYKVYTTQDTKEFDKKLQEYGYKFKSNMLHI